MSVRNLEALLRPRSVAVIGASARPASVGGLVLRNLLRGGFAGPILPVHPKLRSIAGVLAYPDVASLPEAADLALVCTPAATVPAVVAALGAVGTRAAVVLSAGVAQARDAAGRSLVQAMLEAARPHGLRVLGPNCLGLGVPGIGLDATFAHLEALPGELAFVSQSGAVCTVALDWARGSEVGFSHFVSLGDSADVDAADLLDWLGSDPGTRAILLYLESIRGARKFLSAARAAARNKPVIAIKSGRFAEGARAAASHTGALAGADDVCDAALRRAGVLRVARIDELFDAAETLVRSRPLAGDRVAVLSNGGGLGVLAADRVVASGGRLAALAETTVAALDAVLPPTWSRGNPIDIIGDASGERYAAALRAVLADPDIDLLLVVHAPTALAPSEDAARAVAGVVQELAPHGRVWTSWPGRVSADPARRILREAGVASYDTPEDAVAAFARMLAHRRNQSLLMETPPSLPFEFAPDVAAARRPIESALAEGRELLSEPEAKQVLAAFGIAVVPTEIASDADEAVAAARRIGFPVALKILSPHVTHKSDVGGVALDLATPEAVAEAARAMASRLCAEVPGDAACRFTVQPMARRPGARELIAGAACDPVFGPFVLFGHGGTDVEVIGDRAVALPPLNVALARELVSRTRVAKLLGAHRGAPPADVDAVCLALVQVAQIVVDLPEVVELDVNPLLADARGVLALDARVRVAPAAPLREAVDRLAIRPYPRELEETIALRDGRRVRVRPIRPEDEPAHQALFASLSPEDVRFRFFNLVKALPHSQMARYTQIDYDREMAFVAVDADAPDERKTLGVARAIFDPDRVQAEFAILVRSDEKGHGIGHALLDKLVRYCHQRGAQRVVGQVLPDNRAMLELAEHLGFARRFVPGEGVVEVRRELA